ncbi:virulence factor TspB C-terminal domain-related protein [Xanthomonas arboricola]|uniref:virulence factor TspB C-terminal domain-related protein n=1 Tax=Xanthomonas arboricola TaxID=56448 RepID=UPI00118D29C0|nr:virulence factor TspB C-terminal domain-related protein [Xanthomonas arboricola]QDS16179.1 hypothetical protein FPL04_11395 [Xanthomonas arboricola]
MHWLARVFASAIARRVAYVIVALIFSMLGMSYARAADTSATAHAKCTEWASNYQPKDTNLITGAGTCVDKGNTATGRFWQCQYQVAAYYNGPVSTATCGEYPYEVDDTCSKKPDYNIPFPSVHGAPRNGSLSCFSGCRIAWFDNGDGTYNGKFTTDPGQCSDTDLDSDQECKSSVAGNYYYNAALGVCEPEPPKECPAGQGKNAKGECEPNACPDGMTLGPDGTCKPSDSECPAGNIKSPSGKCLPGDGQCASGEALGKDGTCKRDANGDGKPDEEDQDGDDDKDKDSASGGDSCDFAPSCSGNVIQCLQVKIQWRIDCNTRRSVNISGGACAAMPVCTGDGCKAMEYAQLIQQWKSACALEKLAKGDKPTPGTDAADKNGNGVPDALEGRLQSDGPGDGKEDVEGSKRFGLLVSTDRLDRDNIFGGGTCPQPPTFTIKGTTISGADFPYFCQFAAILRALILMFGAYLAIKILMGWGF